METNIEAYIKDSVDALFHYTKLPIAVEKILFDRKLRLSLTKNTNDPREYSYRYFYATGSRMPPGFQHLYTQALDELDRLLHSEGRILCFCSNKRPTIMSDRSHAQEDPMAVPTGWAKPRMWAQYGLNHTGVCLVFSKEELERQLSHIADFNRFDFVRYGPAEVIGTLGMTINGNALSDQGVSVACLNHFKGNAPIIAIR